MPPIHEGSLAVRIGTGLKGRWIGRHGVITDDAIVFYVSNANNELMKPPIVDETIELWSIVKVEWLRKQGGKRFNVFIMCDPSSDKADADAQQTGLKRLRFMADSQTDSKTWIDQILAAVRDSQRRQEEEQPITMSDTLGKNWEDMLSVSFQLPRIAADLPQAGKTLRGPTTAALPTVFDIPQSPAAQELSNRSRRRNVSITAKNITRIDSSNDQKYREDKVSPLLSFQPDARKHKRATSEGTSPRIQESQSTLRTALIALARNEFGESQVASIKKSIFLMSKDSDIISLLCSIQSKKDIRKSHSWISDQVLSSWQTLLTNHKMIHVLQEIDNYESLDENAIADFIRLEWSLLSYHHQVNQYRYHSDKIRDIMADFVCNNIPGRRISNVVKDTLVSLLIMESAFAENPTFWMGKCVTCPEIWKCLLLSTVDCPADVKNNAFRDITSLLVENTNNMKTLYNQEGWLDWLLTPVRFSLLHTKTEEVKAHNALRLNIVAVILEALLFSSECFNGILLGAMKKIYSWGTTSLPAAVSLIEVILNRLIRARTKFPHDVDTLPWRHLELLMKIVFSLVFSTMDWGSSNELPDGYLVDAQKAAKVCLRNNECDARFGTLMEFRHTILLEKAGALLKSLRLDQPSELLLRRGHEDKESSAARALRERLSETCRTVRLASLLHILLIVREDTLNKVQNASFACQFLAGCDKFSRTIEVMQRIVLLPVSEERAYEVLRSQDMSEWMCTHIFPRDCEMETEDVVRELLTSLDIKTHTHLMRQYENCFETRAMIKKSIQEGFCPDVESAIVLGLLLQGLDVIQHVNSCTAFSYEPRLYFRIPLSVTSRQQTFRRLSYKERIKSSQVLCDNTYIDENDVTISVPDDQASIIYQISQVMGDEMAGCEFSYSENDKVVDLQLQMIEDLVLANDEHVSLSLSSAASSRDHTPSSKRSTRADAVQEAANILLDVSKSRTANEKGDALTSHFFRGSQIVNLLVQHSIASSARHAEFLGNALLDKGFLVELDNNEAATKNKRRSTFLKNAQHATKSWRGSSKTKTPRRGSTHFVAGATIYRFVPRPG